MSEKEKVYYSSRLLLLIKTGTVNGKHSITHKAVMKILEECEIK